MQLAYQRWLQMTNLLSEGFLERSLSRLALTRLVAWGVTRSKVFWENTPRPQRLVNGRARYTTPLAGAS